MKHECRHCGHSSAHHHHARTSIASPVHSHSHSHCHASTPMPRVTTANRPKVSPQKAEPDLFESSLSLEDQHIKEGYEQGLSEGRQEGAQEGRELGLQKGFELAQELGFYRGCLQVWEQQSAAHADLIPARARKTFPGLHHLLDSLKEPSPKDEDLQNQLESLRSKFRTVIAIMGIQDEILLPSTAAEALTF